MVRPVLCGIVDKLSCPLTGPQWPEPALCTSGDTNAKIEMEQLEYWSEHEHLFNSNILSL